MLLEIWYSVRATFHTRSSSRVAFRVLLPFFPIVIRGILTPVVWGFLLWYAPFTNRVVESVVALSASVLLDDILDAIEVVNLVLYGEYNELVDMNFDGTINILDIIDIIYIILN